MEGVIGIGRVLVVFGGCYCYMEGVSDIWITTNTLHVLLIWPSMYRCTKLYLVKLNKKFSQAKFSLYYHNNRCGNYFKSVYRGRKYKLVVSD